jgi:hypothetical protein
MSKKNARNNDRVSGDVKMANQGAVGGAVWTVIYWNGAKTCTLGPPQNYLQLSNRQHREKRNDMS